MLNAQESDTSPAALARGVVAFKSGLYTDAASAFRIALSLDPMSSKARLYLATTYATQVVPGDVSPDNLALAQKAIDTLKSVPPDDPDLRVSLKQLASVYRNIKRLDEARTTERAALKLDPTDAAGFYTIGVIDWTQAYKFATAALAQDALTDDGLGNPKMTAATCKILRVHNAPLIADAIDNLNRAVELKPDYSDAMSYLNLVYRRKADFDCNDPAARAQNIATAETWTRRASEARAYDDPQQRSTAPTSP